ncbi:MAG: 1-acyl-sn-glycerol-3-phosphate acyltransferase [Tannerellaceae bacterium]|nr:1-acyl-sn-glycerol-3-phosphate acyltransferase [Tannerellaceae bacterium]
MTQPSVLQIDVKKVLVQKSPKLASFMPRFVTNYLAKTIHQDEINDILIRYRDVDGVDFMQELIHYFDLKLIPVNQENIPSEGRFIFVSNHPLGGMDGICLSAYIGGLFNNKIRYLVNDVLLNIPNLQFIFIPINKYGRQKKDVARLTDDAFASDNQIVTFPAGLCSRRQNGVIQDLEWKKSFIQKAIQYQRDIIPVYFGGQNSDFFYRFASIRKAMGIKFNIELFYLPDELFKAKHSTYTIYFGKPIPWQTFDTSKKPSEWAEYVKNIVYSLSQ